MKPKKKKNEQTGNLLFAKFLLMHIWFLNIINAVSSAPFQVKTAMELVEVKTKEANEKSSTKSAAVVLCAAGTDAAPAMTTTTGKADADATAKGASN